MRDLNRYARQTNTRLFFGFILLLFLIGDGLILVFYGSSAALMGLVCLGLGLLPLVVIFLVLFAIEWFVKYLDSRNG
jgi:hypothetical protein